jgi:cell division protein FtsL
MGVRVSTGAMDVPGRRLRRPVEKGSHWEEPQARRVEKRARRRAFLGRVFFVLAVAGSLASVVWRQTEGVARQRELTRIQNETSIAEAERVEWANRIQALQTRARITRVAQQRLGLHVARDDEVVLLPIPASAMEERP